MLRKASWPLLLTALLAASCGDSLVPTSNGPIAGSWVTPANPSLPGSSTEMTLLTSGSQVSGTGVAHVEAGLDQPFTVAGDATQLTFTFTSGLPLRTFAVAMPDANHLQLTDSAGPELFERR